MASPPTPHLLIVDDDGELLEVLKYLLEDESYRVSTAESGESALAIAAEEDIDLVLLDIAMQDMNGIEVAQRLRADPRTANLRIVLHSGHAESALRGRFAEFDGFIAKSEDPEDVMNGIRAALSRPRAATPEAEPQAG